MDTGASNHLASDKKILQQARPFAKGALVILGNGSTIPIKHVDHAYLYHTLYALKFSHLLVEKNLVSINEWELKMACIFLGVLLKTYPILVLVLALL